MKSLSPEQLAKLKEPLPKEAVKPHPTKTYLSSIKAIYVVERLNDVFGIGGWFAENVFIERSEKWVVVKSTFKAPEYGIVIPDIFGGNDNQDLGDAYKGACTDALTKIGSYLGIGMDVYKGLSDNSKNGTTLYNHKEIKKEGKPLISNEQFKKVCDRVKAGDAECYQKTKSSFSMVKEQSDLLELFFKQLKTQPA